MKLVKSLINSIKGFKCVTYQGVGGTCMGTIQYRREYVKNTEAERHWRSATQLCVVVRQFVSQPVYGQRDPFTTVRCYWIDRHSCTKLGPHEVETYAPFDPQAIYV